MVVWVFLLAFAASTAGSICGIGGGIVMKPVLDSFGIMPAEAVSFLSGCTVLTMSVVSLLRGRGGHELDGRRSVFLGLGAALGGAVGKGYYNRLVDQVGHEDVLTIVQSSLLMLLLIGTILYLANRQKIKYTHTIHSPLACVVIGLLIGMLSSFLGIGGGPINLVVLCYFFSMSTKKAAKNSLLMVLLSQATSFGQTVLSGNVPVFAWGYLLTMMGAGVVGALFGSRIYKRLTEKQADAFYLGLLAVIVCICAFNITRAIA